MAFFAPHIRGLLCALVALLILLAPAATLAEEESPHEPLEIATILNPPLEGEVAPLDCLILIEIDEYYVGEDYYYLILLDEEQISARWDPDALTFSYYPDTLLDPGEHEIKVYMSQVGGMRNQLVAQGKFTVTGAARVPRRAAPGTLFDLGAGRARERGVQPVRGRETDDFFRLSGRTSIDSTFVSIEGLGQDLRQEPPNTAVLDLSGRGRSSGTAFDFRVYVTTDETRFSQPRNRYTFNVAQSTEYGFSIGDATPRLGPLSIEGLRVRGAYGWGTVGPITLHLAEGQARRETPSQYGDDGRIRRRGQGERRIRCARLAVWEDEPFTLGFSYLQGEEEPSDAENTGNPGENTVKSLDSLWEFDRGHGSIEGAWASSDYDYDDPDQEDTDGAEARNLEASYRIGDHTLKAEWELIEPGFVSLGRSSLHQDRETFGLEDRLNIDRGRITGRLYWEQFHNNVIDILDFTTTSARYGGQVRYRFGLRGPTLEVGYQMMNRSNDAAEGESGQVDEQTEGYTVGLSHSLDFLGGRHDLRASWRTSDRSSRVRPDNDSSQDTITIRLSSRWTSGFQLDLLYGKTDNDYSAADRFTKTDRYSVRLGFTPQDRSLELWARWEGVNSDGSEETYESERNTLELGMRWNLGEDLMLEASLTLVDFDDQADDANDFEEHTIRLILTHLLN